MRRRHCMDVGWWYIVFMNRYRAASSKHSRVLPPVSAVKIWILAAFEVIRHRQGSCGGGCRRWVGGQMVGASRRKIIWRSSGVAVHGAQ